MEKTYKLTDREADVIVQSLAKMPFEAVHEVVSKMQKQFLEQAKSEAPTSQQVEQ